MSCVVFFKIYVKWKILLLEREMYTEVLITGQGPSGTFPLG